MKNRRWIMLAVVGAAVAAFLVFDLGQYLQLDYFQSRREALEAYRAAYPLLTGAAFFCVYVAVCALSIPGATILTLLAGALFGVLWGTLVVSFASSLGATLAFLVSRYLLRDAIQKRYGKNLGAINLGVERDGAFYLLSIRLVPAFPFFLVNLVMGLTPIKTWTFYWVSQLGMFAGTLIYVNAGTQLAKLESAKGILSPGLWGAFLLLALFPLLARKLLATIKDRKRAHL